MECSHPAEHVHQPLEGMRWCEVCGAINTQLEIDGWRYPHMWLPSGSGFMDTVSGRKIKILEPSPDDVDIGDIAHHSSMLVRFCGAIQFFYSVGEHSLNVANTVYHLLHQSNEDVERAFDHHHVLYTHNLRVAEDLGLRNFWGAVLRGLFHDGSESYICDCIRPLKQLLPAYKRIEQLHMDAIHTRLGFSPDEDWTWADRIVEIADLAVFRIEEKVLRGEQSPEAYPGLQFCYRENWTLTRNRILWMTEQILPRFRASA